MFFYSSRAHESTSSLPSHAVSIMNDEKEVFEVFLRFLKRTKITKYTKKVFAFFRRFSPLRGKDLDILE